MEKAKKFSVIVAAALILAALPALGAGAPPAAGKALNPLASLPRVGLAEGPKLSELKARNQGAVPMVQAGFERCFAEAIRVEFSPGTAPEVLPAEQAGGLLERGASGALTWTGMVRVAGAYAIMLQLRGVDLPEGAKLWVYGPHQTDKVPLNMETRSPEGDLLAPPVLGSMVLIRLDFPSADLERASFEVAGVQEIVRPDTGPAEPQGSEEGLAEESAPQTLAVPAPPSNLVATPMAANMIRLTWNRNSSNETGFKIQRRIGTSGSFTKIGNVGAGVTQYTDGGVSAGITYTYRVKAVNMEGASGPSNEAVIMTGMPGTFTLTGTTECVSNTPRARLTWTASTYATTYDVYRNGVLYYAGVATLEYVDNTVTAGQTYTYYVQGRNSYGTINSNSISVTAPANCCPPPGNFTVTATGECVSNVPRVIVSWTASSGATSYDVYKNNAVFATGVTANSITDTNVTAGTTYGYHCIARNSCGTLTSNSASATAPATCCPPPSAFWLTVTPYCQAGVPGYLLNWTVTSSVTYYEIWRDGLLVYTYASPYVTYFDAMPGGTVHYYFVRASNGCGRTDSNVASGMAPTGCYYADIVDDLDPGFHRDGPDLYWHSVYGGGYDGHFWYTTNLHSAPAVNSAQWYPSLNPNGPGYYTVYVWIPCDMSDKTYYANYLFYHGPYNFIGNRWISQYTAACNGWIALGDFYMYADGYDFVELGDTTGEPDGSTVVVFDAIRWVK